MALFAILIGSLPILVARLYWRRFGAGGGPDPDERGLFLRWMWLGAIIPVVLWTFFNLELLGPTVWPGLPMRSAGLKAWFKAFDRFAFVSTLIIISYWAGITFAWLLVRIVPATRQHREFAMLTGSWSLLLVPLAVLLLMVGGWWLLGLTLTLCCLPLVHMAVNLQPEKPPAPLYSRALAKISFGKYDEAEAEVIRELEQFENDFDGWMMLAELYATHFNDLAGAHQTLRDLCAQPATTPVQISIALHRLADWHLKFGHDPLGARAALEEICARMPGTHLERMARQRLDQLPATRRELEEKERGKPMPLPHLPDVMEEAPRRTLTPEQARAGAAEFVEALTKNPDDVIAREEFARVLAEHLGDADTAIDQLQLLLAMPRQPAERRGHWLLTIAGWHFRHRDDLERARLVYQEVLRDFANTPHAIVAQRRMQLLEVQSRVRRRARAM